MDVGQLLLLLRAQGVELGVLCLEGGALLFEGGLLVLQLLLERTDVVEELDLAVVDLGQVVDVAEQLFVIRRAEDDVEDRGRAVLVAVLDVPCQLFLVLFELRLGRLDLGDGLVDLGLRLIDFGPAWPPWR